MIAAVDTNVILDVVLNDPGFADRSHGLLAEAYDSGSMVVCSVVYAELAPQFDAKADLDSVLSTLCIKVNPIHGDTAWLAGRKWAEYRAGGGDRKRILPDFLIGAHALLHAECLLTRDRGFYKTYFPELLLMAGG